MFKYKEQINEIYNCMDQMVEARGLEKVILATKIISAANDLEKGLDETAEKMKKLETEIMELKGTPQRNDEQ